MSSAQILALGAVAGSTIFLGLPVARLRAPRLGLTAFLGATATGILLFLLWDVLSGAVEPVESALTAASRTHTGSWAHFAGLATVFGGCFAVGLLSLVSYAGWLGKLRQRFRLGPGAATTGEFSVDTRGAALSPAHRLALMIATGIGLHNFSEGLAIGQSAARDEVSLALMLIIGFGLHNATEGFGIVAPMTGESRLPSWRFLALLGIVGGAPTFFGTLLGQAWTSEVVSIAFLALAGGSILYVVIELLAVCRSFGRRQLVAWGVLLGLVAGFATDLILVAAGA